MVQRLLFVSIRYGSPTQIKSNNIVSDSPGAVSFAALPQHRLVSVQRVRGAECDRWLMIIVCDVEQECLDTTSKCLNGCCGTLEWWQAVPMVPDMWCCWAEGTRCDQCLCSELRQRVLSRWLSAGPWRSSYATLQAIHCLMGSQCNELQSTIADEWYDAQQPPSPVCFEHAENGRCYFILFVTPKSMLLQLSRREQTIEQAIVIDTTGLVEVSISLLLFSPLNNMLHS